MGEQNVIRLRGVTIYHTDDPFGSRSEKKLLQQGELILSDLNRHQRR
jgi:cell division transport system ATP-binding protein